MDAINKPLEAIQQHLAFISTDPINWKKIVVSCSWGVWALETYVSIRQYPNFSKKEPPPALASHFTPEVFAKSQAYGRDKARFGFFSSFYSQLLDFAFIYFDGHPWCWSTAGMILTRAGFNDNEIIHSILYGVLLVLSTSIPSLPVSAYQHFVLEEKHGFNKMTPMLFVTDTLKGWLLGLVFGAPFLACFLWIVRWAGNRFVPWLMTFIIAFQLIMVVLYPTVIQPLFNKLSPLPQDALRTRIEALATRLKFPLKHLYVIDGSKRSSHSNAYFYGLPWSKHIVIFDTLIKQSSPEEIEAVLAHELGHWAKMHPTKLLAVSQIHLLAILALFPAFLKSPPLLLSFNFPPSVAQNPPVLLAFMLFQMVITPAEAVVGMLMNAVSRRFEWEADRFACELSVPEGDRVEGKEVVDMGGRLSNALISLHVENLSTVWVDWLYSAYHHSHPTLTERLKAMDEYRTFAGRSQSKKEL